MPNKAKAKSESELEWAERDYEQSKAAWERFQELHPEEIENTSWPAVVADKLATLELRRAGDDKTMSHKNTDAWLVEQARRDREAASPGATPPAEEGWTPAAILELVEGLGRKLEVNDMDDDLYSYAVEWLAAKSTPISFEFLADLRQQMDDGKTLSMAQAKGVLNCVVADARRGARAHAPAPGVVPGPGGRTAGPPEGPQRAALTPGIYALVNRNGAPEIFKVQAAIHGSKHLYAKRLIAQEGGGAKGRFEFEKGAISKLTPEDRLSLEDAKKYGAIYGVCIVCGALLTDEDSIEAGIGPVCAGKL